MRKNADECEQRQYREDEKDVIELKKTHDNLYENRLYF